MTQERKRAIDRAINPTLLVLVLIVWSLAGRLFYDPAYADGPGTIHLASPQARVVDDTDQAFCLNTTDTDCNYVDSNILVRNLVSVDLPEFYTGSANGMEFKSSCVVPGGCPYLIVNYDLGDLPRAQFPNGFKTDATFLGSDGEFLGQILAGSMKNDASGAKYQINVGGTGAGLFQSVSDVDGPGTNWGIDTSGNALFAGTLGVTGTSDLANVDADGTLTLTHTANSKFRLESYNQTSLQAGFVFELANGSGATYIADFNDYLGVNEVRITDTGRIYKQGLSTNEFTAENEDHTISGDWTFTGIQDFTGGTIDFDLRDVTGTPAVGAILAGSVTNAWARHNPGIDGSILTVNATASDNLLWLTPATHADGEVLTLASTMPVWSPPLVAFGTDPAATCTVGTLYLDTDGTTTETNCTGAGSAAPRLCACSPANTWTVM